MKKCLAAAAMMALSIGSVGARSYTNKTFLMPRSHNENLAMETTGWHKMCKMIDEDKWGACLQATPFVQRSENRSKLGKYFGSSNNAILDAENSYAGEAMDFIWVKPRDEGAGTNAFNHGALLLCPSMIFHDYNTIITAQNRINVQGLLRPRQESYGVRLDYHQKLDKLTNGLYFKVEAPIVHVKNTMGLKVTSTCGKTKQTLANNGTLATCTGNQVSLNDYLAGKVSNSYVSNKQAALTHAKIDGPDSTTAVADIEATLGYNFKYFEEKHFGAKASLTVPVGTKPNGKKLFQAVVGNGNHWAFGMGLDSASCLWQESDDRCLDLNLALNYKYLLPNTQVRTLGLKYSDTIQDGIYITAGQRIGFAHYMLGAQHNKKGVFPLANVLTREVRVHPGSMIEGAASLCLNWGKFSFDLGYNLYGKEKESVTVKDWSMTDSIAIADNSYNTLYNFNAGLTYDGTTYHVQDGSVGWANGRQSVAVPIAKEHLLTDDAATPVYVTHKIYGGANYCAKDWKYPMLFGIGGSWEFVQGSNAALDGWGVWTKIGVNF
jgi:hypothetical protein